MNNLVLDEYRALELMKKENFRGISKDNVLQLMSILDKVDPEVAKVIIAQMSEVVKGVVENEKVYAGILCKGIESCNASTKSCYQTEDVIIHSLQKEVEKENISFEQKQYYFDRMAEVAQRKEGKDTEHMNMILTILKYSGEALSIGLFVTAGVYIWKDVKLSTFKKV